MAGEESEYQKIFSRKVTEVYTDFDLEGIGSGKELMDGLVHHAGRESAKEKRKRARLSVQNKEKLEILRGLDDGEYCTIRDIPSDSSWRLGIYKRDGLIEYEDYIIDSQCSITEKGKEELGRLEEESKKYKHQ